VIIFTIGPEPDPCETNPRVLTGVISIDLGWTPGDDGSPIDTKNAAGKAFLDMLSVFAEFETNLRKEWQAEGVAATKARGVYKGRKPSVKADAIQALRDQGKGATEIAKALGIGRASVYRVPSKKSADDC
jgi:DNA invertase Pin-like site-specific DNA recombinase